jgi:hypothetical protein
MSRQPLPTQNVGSGRHLYDEIEGILATGTPPPKSFGEFGELLGSGEIDREQPLPSDRASDWIPDWARSPDPDGIHVQSTILRNESGPFARLTTSLRELGAPHSDTLRRPDHRASPRSPRPVTRPAQARSSTK